MLPIRPANAAVVLAAVLGSRTVEMLATQRLTTHGPRASRPAKVHFEEDQFFVPSAVTSIVSGTDCLAYCYT